nr:PREDICTED: DEAD-box ATP-dependent RNA helicase 57-like isoform X2 [Musa acuminata subsp. malaccensis]
MHFAKKQINAFGVCVCWFVTMQMLCPWYLSNPLNLYLFWPKKEPDDLEGIADAAPDALPKVKANKKEKKRKRKDKDSSDAVEGFSVFKSSESLSSILERNALEVTSAEMKKDVEKEIEKASILRKKYGIHISRHVVPPPLESFGELSSR